MYKSGQLAVQAGQGADRLDLFLVEKAPGFSRSQWKTLIQAGQVTVNGDCCKPNQRLKPGDRIEWRVPDAVAEALLPENIPLEILYEDDALLVLNKQPALVVHPAAGNQSGTLVNALLFHDPLFESLNRAGIVHRLDKDTSGVMVVAKSEDSIIELQRQFKARETEKEYLALVRGEPPQGGYIETGISRHPVHRRKMAVLKEGGRKAVTHYETLERFEGIALVRVKIETGRTHQIRVHMAHIGHPILGDKVYGRARSHKPPLNPSRQMLHAARLTFNHPLSGKRLSFEAPLFDDMKRILEALRSIGQQGHSGEIPRG